MALTLRTGTGAFPTSSGAAMLTIAKPSGAASGDLLLLLIVTANDVVPTAPGGFVMVPGAQVTGTTRTTVFQKIATSDEPDNYWLNWPSGNGTALMCAIAASGGNVPVVHQVATASSDSASTDKTWASVTNTDTNTLLMCFGGFGSSAASTPDAAMTERVDTGNPRVYLMTQAVASSGATGTRTATGSSVASQRCITISVSEAMTSNIVYPDEVYVTELPVHVELAGEGIEVTSLPVFAELGAVGIYVTAMPVLVEFEATISYYAVGIGADLPAFALTRLTPQPHCKGVRVTRRSESHNNRHLDEALWLLFEYNVLESEAEYREVLDQWGLLDAKQVTITCTARDADHNWQRWVGIATRPEMGVDIAWQTFPRNIGIVVRDVRLAE
jgi:hypothetical protein